MPIDIPLGTETAGYTVTIDGRTYRPVLVDSSGRLLAIVQAAGGDKLFAMESVVEERVVNNDLAVGGNYLSGAVVPAGKVWVITQIAARYTGTPPTWIHIYADGLATLMPLLRVSTPLSGQYYPATVNTIMQAGDKMTLEIIGATLGDDAELEYSGYQMDAP